MKVVKKKGRPQKFDQPLTLGGFLEGLDKFYEGKIEPRFISIEHRLGSVERKLIDHDRRFDEVNERLDGHDKKFDEIYNHIDGLYKKFEDLKIEYHMITAALERIENYIKEDVQDKKAIRADIAKLKSDVAALTNRIETLEKQAAA